jgi:prepilin peptidase CpaA
MVVAAAVADIKTGKVHNVITYPAIAIGLIGHTLAGYLTGADGLLGFVSALAGLAVGSTLILAWLAGGVGGGDAKLMAAVGALMGARFTIAAMFWGFLAAAAMALAVMIRKRVVIRTLVRIWRFLCLAVTPGKPASPVLADSPRVPFGLALCIGAAGAVIQELAGAENLILGI